MFGCVRGAALIVCFKSCFEIFSKSDVSLIGIRNAAEEIDVIHSSEGPY